MKIDSPSGPIAGLPVVESPGRGRPAATAAVVAVAEFTRGQLVQGRMVGVNPAGESLLEFGGGVVAFRSAVPVPLGKEVWLEVMNPGPPLVLTGAEKKGLTAELVRLLLPEKGALAQAAAALTQAGNGSAPVGEADRQPGPPRPESIAAMAVDGQADVKKLFKFLAAFGAGGRTPTGKQSGGTSLLSQIGEFANSLANSEGGAEKVEASVVKLAKAVALMQNVNQQPAATEQLPFYLAPCFFAGSAGWGEWMFWGGKEEDAARDDSGGGQYGLAFYLEMSKLGDLHLQVAVRQHSLQGQFSVASPEVLAHLQTQLPELHTLLQGHGYQPVQLSCRLAQRDLLLDFKHDLEQKAALTPSAMVNVVV